MKKIITFLILLALAFAFVPTSPAATAVLSWDVSPSPEVSGYRIFYGGAPRTYTNTFAVGNTNTSYVSNLAFGGVYYFAATAFTGNGLESELSNEVSYAVPTNFFPVIVTQPMSQTVTRGLNVTFNVAATSGYTNFYQWQFNGNNLQGATSTSYTIANVQGIHAGDYTAVITNQYGSVTSQVAVLRVLLPPSAVQNLRVLSITP